jgi:hypothetical protein
LGLRNVLPHLIGIRAAHRPNELPAAAVNLNARNGSELVLLRHGRTPIDDVYCAQCDFRIRFGQLLKRERIAPFIAGG